jgi:hypothetical protein
MLDLNDLVIDLGGFELVEAYDISDTGYIVARALSATEERVVLLTPTGSAPLPPSLALLGGGLGLLAAARARSRRHRPPVGGH